MLLYFLSSKDMIFLILHKKSVRSIIHAHILIHSKVKEKMQIHSITPTRIYMRNTIQTDCLPKLSMGHRTKRILRIERKEYQTY